MCHTPFWKPVTGVLCWLNLSPLKHNFYFPKQKFIVALYFHPAHTQESHWLLASLELWPELQTYDHIYINSQYFGVKLKLLISSLKPTTPFLTQISSFYKFPSYAADQTQHCSNTVTGLSNFCILIAWTLLISAWRGVWSDVNFQVAGTLHSSHVLLARA